MSACRIGAAPLHCHLVALWLTHLFRLKVSTNHVSAPQFFLTPQQEGWVTGKGWVQRDKESSGEGVHVADNPMASAKTEPPA